MTLGLMEGVVVVAARALGNPAAVVAQQGGRKAASVKEQDHLVARLQVLSHSGNQCRREPGLNLLTFQIQHVLNRRTGITRATRQAQHMVFTLAHVVQRFERRRGGAENNGNLLAVRAVYR